MQADRDPRQILFLGGFDFFQHTFGARQQRLARLGQHQVAATAFEQSDAELLFE